MTQPPRRRNLRDLIVALGLVVVVVLALAVGLPWLTRHAGCISGALHSYDVWTAPVDSQTSECVGISDGPYAFDRPELQAVFDAIAAQNKAVDTGPCPGVPATVGVLLSLNADNAVGRVAHELEGFVATQAAANTDPLCRRPIKLRIGQTGKNLEAASDVAVDLVDSGVVALVGMGLSAVETARAANAVVAQPKPVPMVADLVTAEGFDANGSRVDFPQFDDCDRGGADYRGGIGRNWFYRVGYRNTVQIRTLAKYLAGAPVNFVIKPTSTDDPATCTQLAEIRSQFGSPREVKFSPDANAPLTLDLAIRPICQTTGQVRVFYGARGLDLSTFLATLDQYYDNGKCSADSVTVLAASDSSRLRAPDPLREARRLAALRSPTFRSGRVQLIGTPLADPDLPAIANSDGYKSLMASFQRLKFSVADGDDGWALTAHDALTTVDVALGATPADTPADPEVVNAAIADGFQSDPTMPNANAVDGAIEAPLTFDAAGNRGGDPAVVRLCPLPDDHNPDPRTHSVVLLPTGQPTHC